MSSDSEVQKLIKYINDKKIIINYLFNFGMTKEKIQLIYNTLKAKIKHYKYKQLSILDLKLINNTDRNFIINNLLVQIDTHIKELPEREGGNKYYKKYLKYKYKYLQAKNRLLKYL